MTTKDYKLIASVLREMRNVHPLASPDWTVDEITERFLTALAAANPNFDSERFARAVYALREREPASRTQGKLAEQFAQIDTNNRLLQARQQEFESREAHRDNANAVGHKLSDHSVHDGFCFTCQVWLS